MTTIPFTNARNTSQVQDFSGRFMTPTESMNREYPCYQCNMTIVGAGTLALHAALRHGRRFYQDWVNKTFQSIQAEIQKAQGEVLKFENKCPVPDCQLPVGDTQDLVDFHLMYNHARDPYPMPFVEAYARQRQRWENTYREVRGWTIQDTQAAMFPNNAPF